MDRKSWTDEERLGYDLAERNRRDIEAMIAAGIAEGKAEGKPEGEARKQIVIAKKCLALGMEASIIASATGLDLSKIDALKNTVTGSSSSVFF